MSKGGDAIAETSNEASIDPGSLSVARRSGDKSTPCVLRGRRTFTNLPAVGAEKMSKCQAIVKRRKPPYVTEMCGKKPSNFIVNLVYDSDTFQALAQLCPRHAAQWRKRASSKSNLFNIEITRCRG